jgi:hypothetical protein
MCTLLLFQFLSRPEIAIHKKYPNGKTWRKHAMWSESKRLLNVFKLQIVQEIERDNFIVNPQRLMVFKINNLLNGSENSGNLIGKPNTIYYVKVARTKDHGAWSQSETLEKQNLLERQVLLQIKKAIIFDMMIDIAEEEYKIDIRKNLHPNNRPF